MIPSSVIPSFSNSHLLKKMIISLLEKPSKTDGEKERGRQEGEKEREREGGRETERNRVNERIILLADSASKMSTTSRLSQNEPWIQELHPGFSHVW